MSTARKIKLLFILDAFPDPQAGTEGQFWLLFNQLDRSRVEPMIVLLQPSEWLQSRVPADQIRVLDATKLKSPVSILKFIALALWARRQKFEIAHIFFNDSAVAFPALLSSVGIRVIVSRRDLGFWYTPANLRVLRFNERFVDLVIANAAAVKHAVQAKEGFAPEKIEVIYNGLRRNDSTATGALRSSLALAPDAPLLAIVANLRPLKRITDAIRALAKLDIPGQAPAHLVIAGEDRSSESKASHRSELEALAASLGVAERIHFVGKIEDPMPLLAESSICLLCSETEGLSNAIIEYMFAGCPVVCTDAGGNAELVEHGRSGFVVPIGDVEAIAAALQRLLTDRSLLAQMGQQARQRALALFHPKAMLQAHMTIYERLRRVAA